LPPAFRPLFFELNRCLIFKVRPFRRKSPQSLLPNLPAFTRKSPQSLLPNPPLSLAKA
jgi:hypothetical protein